MKEDGILGEFVLVNGYSWGGIFIDRVFNEFLISLFGERVMNIF